jgi:hypothetical protein
MNNQPQPPEDMPISPQPVYPEKDFNNRESETTFDTRHDYEANLDGMRARIEYSYRTAVLTQRGLRLSMIGILSGFPAILGTASAFITAEASRYVDVPTETFIVEGGIGAAGAAGYVVLNGLGKAVQSIADRRRKNPLSII